MTTKIIDFSHHFQLKTKGGVCDVCHSIWKTLEPNTFFICDKCDLCVDVLCRESLSSLIDQNCCEFQCGPKSSNSTPKSQIYGKLFFNIKQVSGLRSLYGDDVQIRVRLGSETQQEVIQNVNFEGVVECQENSPNLHFQAENLQVFDISHSDTISVEVHKKTQGVFVNGSTLLCSTSISIAPCALLSPYQIARDFILESFTASKLDDFCLKAVLSFLSEEKRYIRHTMIIHTDLSLISTCAACKNVLIGAISSLIQCNKCKIICHSQCMDRCTQTVKCIYELSDDAGSLHVPDLNVADSVIQVADKFQNVTVGTVSIEIISAHKTLSRSNTDGDLFVQVFVNPSWSAKTHTVYANANPVYGSKWRVSVSSYDTIISFDLMDYNSKRVVGSGISSIFAIMQAQTDSAFDMKQQPLPSALQAKLTDVIDIPLHEKRLQGISGFRNQSKVVGFVRVRLKFDENFNDLFISNLPKKIPPSPSEVLSVDRLKRHVARLVDIVDLFKSMYDDYRYVMDWKNPLVTIILLVMFIFVMCVMNSEYFMAIPLFAIIAFMTRSLHCKISGMHRRSFVERDDDKGYLDDDSLETGSNVKTEESARLTLYRPVAHLRVAVTDIHQIHNGKVVASKLTSPHVQISYLPYALLEPELNITDKANNDDRDHRSFNNTSDTTLSSQIKPYIDRTVSNLAKFFSDNISSKYDPPEPSATDLINTSEEQDNLVKREMLIGTVAVPFNQKSVMQANPGLISSSLEYLLSLTASSISSNGIIGQYSS